MMTSNSTSATSPSTPASHCSQGALTGTLGLFVQALLAFVAFSALIGQSFEWLLEIIFVMGDGRV